MTSIKNLISTVVNIESRYTFDFTKRKNISLTIEQYINNNSNRSQQRFFVVFPLFVKRFYEN